MDTSLIPADQTSVEMPSGAIGTGMGGDTEAIAEQVEQRHEARTGKEAEAIITDATGAVVEPRTRGQKRFDKLTAEREQEKARADAAERERDELKAKLNAPPPPQPKAESTPAKPAVEPPTRPKPQESEIGTKYLSLSDYIEDLSDWKLEQREVKLRADFDARLDQRIEADRTTRTRTSVFDQAMTRGRAAFSDFDAVLDSAKTILVPPMQQDAILRVAKPEDVMYVLGKDHDKLKAFVKITDPIQLGMEIAALIPRPEAVAQTPASTPVAVQSNAPAPPQPGGSGSRTAQPSLAELANSGNYEAYKARRNADRGVKTA